MDGARLSGRDRRALYAVAGQFFVNGAMTATYVARAPQIRDRIGVEVDEFGLLLTLAASVGMLGSVLAGRVVHAATTRRVLQVGAVVMVATLPVIGAARGPAVWLAAMCTYMVVDVMVDISMNLQGSWISARRHAPVMNRLHGVWSLGLFAGGLGAAAANAVGLSPATHLAAVALLMTTALVAITRNLLTDDEEGHGDTTTPTPSRAPAGPARLAGIVVLGLAGMFAAASEATAGDWAAFRLTDDLGASGAVGSIAFAAYTVGMVAMRFGGDWLQVRHGRQRLRWVSIGLTAIGISIASLVDDPVVVTAGFAVTGLGVATLMPTLYDDAARLPGRRGAGLGALTGGTRIAFLATPVAVGAIAGTSLSVGDAIAVVTLPALVGLAAVSALSDRWLRRGTREAAGT